VSDGLTADEVVAHARARPARLGAGRLICIDGPAGSGKTTLADAVSALTGAQVVHLDDLYAGWTGLFDVDPQVLGALAPLVDGAAGSYRRYDWGEDRYAESHQVDPAPFLVLEGVGAGNRAWSHLVSTLVWVEAPAPVRLSRGLARDGAMHHELWIGWMRDEDRLFAEQGTRARADLVLDTSPGIP
jgi:hypothetical protein